MVKKQQEKPKNNVILGLGIDVCDGDAQHFGATLFQRGEYVMQWPSIGNLANLMNFVEYGNPFAQIVRANFVCESEH